MASSSYSLNDQPIIYCVPITLWTQVHYISQSKGKLADSESEAKQLKVGIIGGRKYNNAPVK